MENLLEILLWTAWVSGGMLVVLLLLSILGGLDLDIDVDTHTDVDVDASGSLGLIKWILVFLAMGALVARYTLQVELHPALALGSGAIAGTLSGLFLSWLMRLLLRNQEEGNWYPEDAIGNEGKVYARIHPDQTGIVKVVVGGAYREIKATASKPIPTGTTVKILSLEEGVLVVEPTEQVGNE
jgi:membrane protein implicated in regulation of membrane protease activity